MSTKVVKFNNKDNPEFFRVLNRRVNQYFKDNNITRFGNTRMVVKTCCMLIWYLAPLTLMLTGVVKAPLLVLLMWLLMGFGMAGIGMSVMHDGNHGAYSSKNSVNKWMGRIVNLIGGYHMNWVMQHNVLHHSFTNIDAHDHDLEMGAMRFSSEQPFNPKFKFQAYYAVFFYGLLTLNWVTAKDFIQLNQFSKDNLLEGQGLTYKKTLLSIVLYKLMYYTLVLALPIYLAPSFWLLHLGGFFMMHFIAGLMLSLIFQAAHVVEETKFFAVDEDSSIENSWAVLQLRTTTNFARKSRFLTWYVGGLNYQIEHHLFPSICHVHYKKLSPIVKATAKEYGLPYYEHTTFLDALNSHFSLLDKLGKGKHPDDLGEKTEEPILEEAIV